MRDSLGDAARARLTDAAAAFLRDRGFEIERPDTRAEPPAVARRDAESVGVEPLTGGDVTPTTVASRIGHSLERNRRALFVVDDDATAAAVRELLADPQLLVADDEGYRTFHAGPDRIPLQEGGYACVHAPRLGDPEIVWREAGTPLGPVPAVEGVDAAATDDEGEPAVPRLLCEVDGRVAVVLAGVESLRTPPAAAVPFRYRRNPEDKQFRVYRGHDGTVVETCSGFSELRRAGYRPLPMPLVPEHVFGPDADVTRECGLLRVDGEPRFVRTVS